MEGYLQANMEASVDNNINDDDDDKDNDNDSNHNTLIIHYYFKKSAAHSCLKNYTMVIKYIKYIKIHKNTTTCVHTK